MSASRVRRSIGAVIASIALLVASLLTAAPAGAARLPAPPPAAPPTAISYYNNYGAIALAMTGGAVGWSYDYASKWQALRAAKNACKSRSSYPWTCEKIAWVRNGCLALAVAWDGDYIDHYGWAVRSTKRAAYWAAKQECGPGCVKRAYTCTTR